MTVARASGVPTARQIRRRFPGGYAAFHAQRYADALGAVARLPLPAGPSVLDVGPSPLTVMLHDLLRVPVDTLGFDTIHFASEAGALGGRHHVYDLNDAQSEDTWLRGVGPYDLITMSEVIEHLHTSPLLVLAFLRSLLREGGYLMVQTPNAAALGRRVRLLLGKNPYHLINEDATNPMHFREYTLDELVSYARRSGFEVVEHHISHTFDPRYKTGKNRALGTVQNLAYRWLPPSLRGGMMLVLRRREGSFDVWSARAPGLTEPVDGS